MSRHNADTIATALRKRVCMEPPTSSPVLHEQALAAEFGVSRTPVRQALQRLAYERLVEVRSGVGTVISPLSPARKAQDIALAHALAHVAAQIEGDRPLSEEAKAYIVALDRQVASAEALDLETNYTIRSTCIHVLTREMTNDILADALKAALWRLFRWRMAEAAEIASGIDPRLPQVMSRMAEATRVGTLRALLAAQSAGPDDAARADAGG
ncbi:GntR family transcriptional regulator [Hasllibacter sp. MH4015]|uniref:GntR family transcriptional regulator n=1 Tax=Hasllibacter sp. MH4015 TaxID=2854029 RepID=UPI001CD74D20|nr:GntR family transcriptional regulator [Hasllibacter sp. MH4015]